MRVIRVCVVCVFVWCVCGYVVCLCDVCVGVYLCDVCVFVHVCDTHILLRVECSTHIFSALRPVVPVLTIVH